MGKIFYHNITKGLLNETDAEDFFNEYEDGDQVFKSEAGDATLKQMTQEDFCKISGELDLYYESLLLEELEDHIKDKEDPWK